LKFCDFFNADLSKQLKMFGIFNEKISSSTACPEWWSRAVKDLTFTEKFHLHRQDDQLFSEPPV